MSIKINLWASPRNISTALMYSFSQRPDTRVYDEPLYAHYLLNSKQRVLHPGENEIIEHMISDEKVLLEIMTQDQVADVLFFKQMTHHLEGFGKSFLNEMKNIILTRDPKDMIASYTKVIENPTLNDLGYKAQADLFAHLQNIGEMPIVIDAKRLLQDPRKQLVTICSKLGIPFFGEMLSWKPGPIPEDGIWAKYWYGNVHKSKGFIPYEKKEVQLQSRYDELLKSCQVYYDKLSRHIV